MRVTQIIDISDNILKRWLEYGIVKGWEECGCDKCKKYLEAIKESKPLPEEK